MKSVATVFALIVIVIALVVLGYYSLSPAILHPLLTWLL